MISQELQKKIDRSIKLLRSIKVAEGEKIEVAYSGGKDSDVILQLAKEAGITYRAIYRNTTIDPPGTIKHCRDNGVEVLQPKKTFAQLIREHGNPTRYRRHCCEYLKEYKILDKCIMGVRREESIKRRDMYKEPTECRFYGSKKNHVEAIYPILDWTLQDVKEFVEDRGIILHPLYKDDNGEGYDYTKRLGCMCCPLASRRKRIEEFGKHPNILKLYLKNVEIYRLMHPNSVALKYFNNEYEQLVFAIFFEKLSDFNEFIEGMFGRVDCKKILEDYFKVILN